MEISHLQAARRWAKAHPQSEVKIVVESWEPTKRGRRKPRRQQSVFFAAGGNAVSPIFTNYPFTNGMCSCCAQMYLEPVLLMLVRDGNHPSIYVCPTCVHARQLPIHPSPNTVFIDLRVEELN